MATNKLFTFGSTSNNILTDTEYQNDSERNAGNSLGTIARSKLVNKVLKQCASVANAMGQLIVNNTSQDASDADPSALATNIAAALKKVYVCESLASGSTSTSWKLNIPDLSSSLTTYGIIVKTTISCGDNMSLVVNSTNTFGVYKTNTDKIASGDIVGTTAAPMAVLFIVSGSKAYYVGGGGSSGIADELAAHIADVNNPHQVTSAQVGCFGKSASIPIVKGVWDATTPYLLVVSASDIDSIIGSPFNLLNGGMIGVYFDTVSTAAASGTNYFYIRFSGSTDAARLVYRSDSTFDYGTSYIYPSKLKAGYTYLLQYDKANNRFMLQNYMKPNMSDVSGKLPVSSGGTGAITIAEAHVSLRIPGFSWSGYTTLSASSWTQNTTYGFYYQDFTISSFGNIPTNANCDITLGIVPGSANAANIIQAAQAANFFAEIRSNNVFRIYAYGDVPTIDIPIHVLNRKDASNNNI